MHLKQITTKGLPKIQAEMRLHLKEANSLKKFAIGKSLLLVCLRAAWSFAS